MSFNTMAVAVATAIVFAVPATAARVECMAGCGSGAPGTAAAAKLNEPFGVAVDSRGNWYICEFAGHRVTKVSADGKATQLVGFSLNGPHALLLASDRFLYIADTLNHRVLSVDLKSGTAKSIAGTGERDFSGDGGPAIAATFNQAYDVSLDRSGRRLYVTDLGNRRVRVVNLRNGTITTVAGNGESGVPADGSVATASPLVDPRAAAVDSVGFLYILERRGNALRLVEMDGKIRTVVGAAAKLNGPKHITIDNMDNVIIADAENHLVRLYNPKNGTMRILAGTGVKGDSIDPSDPVKTQLNRPHGVHVDRTGALWISDSYNNRILKVTGWQ